MNTTKSQQYNIAGNRAKTGSWLMMMARTLAVGAALILAQGSLVAAKDDKPKDKTICEICKSAKAVQTCKHCGKKICAKCRATTAGGKPTCKKCAGED